MRRGTTGDGPNVGVAAKAVMLSSSVAPLCELLATSAASGLQQLDGPSLEG